MTDNLVALVTGGNKGIGKEVVRQLARCGATLMLGSRDSANGEAAAAEIRRDGLNVAAIQLDTTDAKSVRAAAEQIHSDHGRLDILINNAGIHVPKPTLEIAAADMRRIFETNLFGVVTMIHTMLPLLSAAATPCIVNVASTTASLTLTSDPATLFGREDNILAYASSKSALTMLTLQYANAFRRSPDHAHIKINAATPGYVATDLNNHAGPRTVEQGARIIVRLATLGDDGPSGGFFNDDGPVPW